MTKISISDYVKIEEMKRMLATRINRISPNDRVKGALDADFDTIMRLMAALNTYLNERETEDEQIEFLLTYIIGLWGILIIDYNHEPKEL